MLDSTSGGLSERKLQILKGYVLSLRVYTRVVLHSSVKKGIVFEVSKVQYNGGRVCGSNQEWTQPNPSQKGEYGLSAWAGR